jgi:hypothetical protein
MAAIRAKTATMSSAQGQDAGIRSFRDRDRDRRRPGVAYGGLEAIHDLWSISVIRPTMAVSILTEGPAADLREPVTQILRLLLGPLAGANRRYHRPAVGRDGAGTDALDTLTPARSVQTTCK